MKKFLKNQNGSMVYWLIFIIFLFVVLGVFDVDKERIAIADEINDGQLIETPEASQWLKRGDEIMIALDDYKDIHSGNHKKFHKVKVSIKEWVNIFFAKVCYERARLEMEMRKNQHSK